MLRRCFRAVNRSRGSRRREPRPAAPAAHKPEGAPAPAPRGFRHEPAGGRAAAVPDGFRAPDQSAVRSAVR